MTVAGTFAAATRTKLPAHASPLSALKVFAVHGYRTSPADKHRVIAWHQTALTAPGLFDQPTHAITTPAKR